MTTLREVRPGLWLTELILDDFAVRGAVIIGSERALVWDTLSHPQDMAPVAALVGDKPLYVVYSHADWDHCWGSGGLTLERAVVVGHPACAERFATGDVQQKLESKRKANPEQWKTVTLVPPMLTATTLTIELGDVTVQLHSLSGHTRDCMVAFIPQWGVLLAGDTIETPLPFLTEGGNPVREWATHLEGWAAREDVALVVPAHGEVGDRTVLVQTLGYLQALLAGEVPNVPAEMDAFYTATHQTNLGLIRGDRG